MDMSDETRRELDRLVEEERALGRDAPHDDLSDDLREVDLATLLAELAALRVEVRKETTTTRDLVSSMGEAAQSIAAMSQGPVPVTGDTTRDDGAVEELRRTTARMLVDIRERLAVALDASTAAKTPRRRWWHRQTRTGALDGLVEGLTLTLERLDGHLASLGVVPLESVGRRFDASTMRVVERRCEPGRGDLEVLEERSAGYLMDREILQIAEVVVNRNTTPTQTHEEPT